MAKPGETNSRSLLRKVSAAAASAVLLILAGALLGGFIEALAREHGLFDEPTAKVAGVISFLQWLATNDWFQWIGGIVVGFALGVRLDTWLKRKGHPGETPLALRVRYPHTSLEQRIDEGLQRETQFGKDHYRDRIIDIPLLFQGKFHLDDVLFENCVLVGPATLTLAGETIVTEPRLLFEVSPEEMVIELSDERARHLLTCSYQLVRCTLRDCTFYRVAFIGSAQALQPFRNALGAMRRNA